MLFRTTRRRVDSSYWAYLRTVQGPACSYTSCLGIDLIRTRPSRRFRRNHLPCNCVCRTFGYPSHPSRKCNCWRYPGDKRRESYRCMWQNHLIYAENFLITKPFDFRHWRSTPPTKLRYCVTVIFNESMHLSLYPVILFVLPSVIKYPPTAELFQFLQAASASTKPSSQEKVLVWTNI